MELSWKPLGRRRGAISGGRFSRGAWLEWCRSLRKWRQLCSSQPRKRRRRRGRGGRRSRRRKVTETTVLGRLGNDHHHHHRHPHNHRHFPPHHHQESSHHCKRPLKMMKEPLMDHAAISSIDVLQRRKTLGVGKNKQKNNYFASSDPHHPPWFISSSSPLLPSSLPPSSLPSPLPPLSLSPSAVPPRPPDETSPPGRAETCRGRPRPRPADGLLDGPARGGSIGDSRGRGGRRSRGGPASADVGLVATVCRVGVAGRSVLEI